MIETDHLDIRIPASALVVLIGVSGSGKSTFAAQHFGRWETLSSGIFSSINSVLEFCCYLIYLGISVNNHLLFTSFSW